MKDTCNVHIGAQWSFGSLHKTNNMVARHNLSERPEFRMLGMYPNLQPFIMAEPLPRPKHVFQSQTMYSTQFEDYWKFHQLSNSRCASCIVLAFGHSRWTSCHDVGSLRPKDVRQLWTQIRASI